ncbi:MAG: LysR family transcriptional regulator [Myxococcales bacterium]|nr:LysR family transcriptional regulator [Myxococcales bacterium]
MSDFEDISLRDLRLLDRVAELSSITAAARELRVPKATASRWLALLEERVGRRLVERNTRHTALTESGRAFLVHARQLLALAEQAHLAVTTDAPAGRIRVSMPVPMGRMLAGRVAAEFRRRLPAVRLELRLQNDRIDLVRDAIDVVVRGGALPDSELVARKLAAVPLALYGAPEARDRPLDAVPLVASPGDAQLLRRARGVQAEVAVLIDDRLAIADALTGGAGMGMLPAFVGEPAVEAGLLIRLDPKPIASFPVHALFLPSSRHDPRVATFVEVIGACLKATLTHSSG